LTASVIEFVDEAGVAHLAHGLEPGGIYRIIITTRSGLYRYDLGDRVLCRSIQGGVPGLEFVGRSDLVADMTGEKLSEDFVTSCLRGSDGSTLLAPTEHERRRYLLLGDVGDCDAEMIETRLLANPHYRHARQIGQLAPVQVRPIPRLAQAYLDWRAGMGIRLGDIKPPALLRTPVETHGLLDFIARRGTRQNVTEKVA
jgi:hypothetical protein